MRIGKLQEGYKSKDKRSSIMKNQKEKPTPNPVGDPLAAYVKQAAW